MLLLCCIWAGFCTWLSSLIKVENSYAWGLAGYTALIIIVTVATSEAHLLEAPQFAIERCSEIVLGSSAPYWRICCSRRVRSSRTSIERWISCWWINIA